MNFKRIGRIVVCLLLICCLTFHAMIPKAEATSVAVPLIQKAAVVTGNPFVITAAVLITLGITAYGVESGAFETVANNCVDALEAAGTWIKDGAMELLRTEDADGNASYYVDSGMMEDVRSWVWESQNVFLGPVNMPSGLASNVVAAWEYAAAQPYAACWYINSEIHIASSAYPLVTYVEDGDTYIKADGGYRDMHVWRPSGAVWAICSVISGCSGFTYFGTTVEVPCSELDVSLGSFPSQSTNLTDGTSAREWSEDYTDRGLKVYGGGSGNNNNDGKWFWPLALTLTAADLYAMSQADQWAAQTPAEFDDYTEVEELEIVSRPEVDFAQGVELAPVTSPAPDTGGDTGSDTGTESGNQTDYTSWFQKIIKGIEELPSKFADWFNNIGEKLERIGEQIQTLGETIVEGIKNVLSELFSPSEDFLTNQVEALKAKHHNIDNFINLGNEFKAFFAGLGSTPPIIYIDLGAATGSYLWGGRQVFLDLTWYSQYKSKMDFILGGIIWLWLAWRVFLSIPGIINGESGTWGARNEHVDTHYVSGPVVTDQKMLPSGRGSRRFRK